MDPVTIAAIVSAAAPAVKVLIEGIIRLAAGAGWSEEECQSAMAEILESVRSIDAAVISAEARENRIARGELP